MDTVSDFGSRLRELRLLKGWTQEQLAAKVGAKKSSISDYEAGTKYPLIERFTKIVLALNTSADYLLGIKKEMVVDTEGLAASQKIFLANTIQSLTEELKKGK